MRMRQGKYSTDAGLGWQVSPSLDGSQHSEDGTRLTSPEEDGWAALDPSLRRSLRNSLLQFQTLIPKKEALRLIRVYKEVIGELHPIVDCDRLAEQTEGWYNWPGAGSSGMKGGDDSMSDEDSLLILNLVLSITLCAESGCHSENARSLYKNCRGTINIFLAMPVTGLRHVLLTLLMVGFYPRIRSYISGLNYTADSVAYIRVSTISSTTGRGLHGACAAWLDAWPWKLACTAAMFTSNI